MLTTSQDLLNDLRKTATQLDLTVISEEVLGLPEFPLWSGSAANKHHYGKGGLLRHTHEVVTLCMRQQAFFAEMGNRSIPIKPLFLAALFHDVAKTRDYRPLDSEYREWEKAPHAREIHHIAGSAIHWAKAVENTGLCRQIDDEVTHAILAHHGRREWGSPVAPHTKVAWLLHLCDAISARMDDCDRVDMLVLDQEGKG